VRALKLASVVLTLVVSLPGGTSAQQNLNLGLFERNVELLRQEAGIPGLSAVIVQGRRIIWEAGFGFADVERLVRATPDTPYPIADLTQPFAATLLLHQVDRGYLDLTDRMQRWETVFPNPQATVQEVLMHTSTGAYRYDPSRFEVITPVIEYNSRLPFRKFLANEILDRLWMRDSVPGHEMEQPPSADQPFFDLDDVQRYQAVVQRLAVPYQVDIRRRATRSEYPSRRLTAGTGMISTVRDLAKFDAALDDRILLDDTIVRAMWAPAAAVNGVRVPTGLGWFVQIYNNERIVWHFGLSPGAFSSLMLKVPGRDLTLILLANSDGLSSPFGLEAGDVTTSLFARSFLRLFIP
jgi:CubicO group peptidase (beta-lactamase class C family)